jgi:hypothetical protein
LCCDSNGVDPFIVGRASAVFEQAERRDGQRRVGAVPTKRSGARQRALGKPAR